MNTNKKTRILCVYGNPKQGGFVHDCVDHIATNLEEQGFEIDRLRLYECNIEHCIGCFICLRKGNCTIKDDMSEIIERIRLCDGIVTGASVRNGFFPAIFKIFYERLTYILGLSRDLRVKYILGVGAVGFAGGRKHLGKLITFSEFHTYVSDYLFFRTGIPTGITTEEVSPILDKAVDKFYQSVTTRKTLSWRVRMLEQVDNLIIRKLMLERNKDHTYDYVITRWKDLEII